MSKITASIIGVLVMLVGAGSASAQRSTPASAPARVPAPSQSTQAPYLGTNPDRNVGEARPLFFIGQLPVVVWTPVQPPYNAKNNGTQAAKSLWDVDAF